jgi:hypothetical protein
MLDLLSPLVRHSVLINYSKRISVPKSLCECPEEKNWRKTRLREWAEIEHESSWVPPSCKENLPLN